MDPLFSQIEDAVLHCSRCGQECNPKDPVKPRKATYIRGGGGDGRYCCPDCTDYYKEKWQGVTTRARDTGKYAKFQVPSPGPSTCSALTPSLSLKVKQYLPRQSLSHHHHLFLQHQIITCMLLVLCPPLRHQPQTMQTSEKLHHMLYEEVQDLLIIKIMILTLASLVCRHEHPCSACWPQWECTRYQSSRQISFHTCLSTLR